MLDVRRLRLLRELHARGTLAAVAEAFNYTPSAVSQQLAQLERETGTRLLEKAGRSVRLTDAARTLVGHADEILAGLERAEADLAAARGDVVGRVRIGSFQTAARALVLPAIARLAIAHTRLRAELIEVEAEDALPRLRLGDFDIVIAEEYEHAPRARDPALEREDLLTDGLLVALPAGHRLALRREPVALAELADSGWASTVTGTAYTNMLIRACRAAGFEPEIRHQANDIRLLARICAVAGTAAILPALGRPETEPGVAVLPIVPALSRRIFASVRRGTRDHPAVAAAMEGLHRAAEEPAQPHRLARLPPP